MGIQFLCIIDNGGRLGKKKSKISSDLYFQLRYIDDVLSLNNSPFGNYLHIIYPNELEVKNTTDTQSSASYLDRHLEIDNRVRLKTNFYDKRDDFTFPIVNFPFISSNIPASSTYGALISQLIRYSRACTQYIDFLDRLQLLTQNQLEQGFFAPRMKSPIQKSTSQMTTDLFLFT